MIAFLHDASLSLLTSTFEILLDPAKAIPPTETSLPGDVLLPEPEEVELLVALIASSTRL
jgi:hypothetical protein